MPGTKLGKCLKEGGKGKERHKGLRKINFSEEKVKGHITANRRSSLTCGLKPEVLRLSHGLAVCWDEKFRTKVTGFSTPVNFAKFPINKSKHNLKAMLSFHRSGFSDWSASAAFYCLYHGLLAIIAKEGFESRNQSCTFAFIERMIEEDKLSLRKEELLDIYDQDVTDDLEHSSRILDIRESMQYSVKTSLEEQEFRDLFTKTKKLFDKIIREVEKEGEMDFH